MQFEWHAPQGYALMTGFSTAPCPQATRITTTIRWQPLFCPPPDGQRAFLPRSRPARWLRRATFLSRPACS